jgi:hypothetical protein
MLPGPMASGRGILVDQGTVLYLHQHALMTDLADTEGSESLQGLNRVSDVTRIELASYWASRS